jgi:hypothetical protein
MQEIAQLENVYGTVRMVRRARKAAHGFQFTSLDNQIIPDMMLLVELVDTPEIH